MTNKTTTYLLFLTFLLLVTIVFFSWIAYTGELILDRHQVREIYYMQSDYCSKFELDEFKQNTIKGYSMTPTAFEGNTILYIDYEDQILLPGMQIVYTIENRTVMHRIVTTYHTYVITKGDGNSRIDDYRIPYEDIKYIVCGIIYT